MNGSGLRALAATVFGDRCGIGIVRVDSAVTAAPFPDEALPIHHAVPARRQEFAAGRTAARQALGWGGRIPMDEGRAPIWPEGWTGSISHGAGWAIAVARQGGWLTGVDLEPDQDLPPEILSEVLTGDEILRFSPDLRLARRIFAIKEAVYKAQYPVTRQIFDFQTLDVTLSGARFVARFRRPVGRFHPGDAIAGHWASGHGLILAGVLE